MILDYDRDGVARAQSCVAVMQPDPVTYCPRVVVLAVLDALETENDPAAIVDRALTRHYQSSTPIESVR